MLSTKYKHFLRRYNYTKRRNYIDNRLKKEAPYCLRNLVYLVDETGGKARVPVGFLNAHFNMWAGECVEGRDVNSIGDLVSCLSTVVEPFFVRKQFQFMVMQLSVVGIYFPSPDELGEEKRRKVEELLGGLKNDFRSLTVRFRDEAGLFEREGNTLLVSPKEAIVRLGKVFSFLELPFDELFYYDFDKILRKEGIDVNNRHS